MTYKARFKQGLVFSPHWEGNGIWHRLRGSNSHNNPPHHWSWGVAFINDMSSYDRRDVK